MADEQEPQEATKFRVGDQLLDGWGNHVEEDEEALAGSANYSEMSGKELKAEIDRRNRGRDEDAQIVLEDNKKATAVAALEADDEANRDSEE